MEVETRWWWIKLTGRRCSDGGHGETLNLNDYRITLPTQVLFAGMAKTGNDFTVETPTCSTDELQSQWGQFHLLTEYNWTFSNLLDEFKDGGVLHREKVFLFSCIEPQLLYFGGEFKVVHIPSVAAIVAPFPPSDKIGVKSLHMESEEIIDMKNINMGWVPHNIPLGKRSQRLSPQIFLFSRVQTKYALRKLPIHFTF
ncbi:protein HEAT INTOLERANT 4-like [Bidens hawaiensis]|uniref:protein HEAT INTOLERANT 4-like n=1 Tax=Bidens hawaiensis TaxID=980011 RepID=UPI00404B5609